MCALFCLAFSKTCQQVVFFFCYHWLLISNQQKVFAALESYKPLPIHVQSTANKLNNFDVMPTVCRYMVHVCNAHTIAKGIIII